MKHIVLLTILAWLSFLVPVSVGAQDYVSMSATPTDTYNQWTVDICLENVESNNYTALQADLRLPEGFHVVEESVLSTSRLTDHSVSYAKQSTDLIRIIAYSPTNAAVVGNSGAVISLTVEADATVPFGTHTFSLHNIYVSDRLAKVMNFLDAQCDVKIVDNEGQFSITFRVDGEVYTVMSLPAGATVMTPPDPNKEGHTFVGWNGLPETMPAKDISVEAMFSVNSYTITYMAGGRVFTTQKLKYGSKVVAPQRTPSKEGHTFVEWEGLPETMPAADTTVEAKFSVNSYTIYYYVDGELHSTQVVEYGATIVPPEVTPDEGRVWSGWSGLPEKMPAQDLHIYGVTEADAIHLLRTGEKVNVYSLQGILLMKNVSLRNASTQLPTGVYVINGQKIFIQTR